MKQTRKGRHWRFGMKLHVGTDRRGLVHSVVTGPASKGDITRLDELLHGQERALFGDQAYWSEDHRQQCRHAGIRYRVNRRAKPGRTLTERDKAINRSRSRHGARGEHAFHVIKNLWGFTKVRYRGLVQEHSAGADPVRAVEPVPRAPIVVAAAAKVRLMKVASPPKKPRK